MKIYIQTDQNGIPETETDFTAWQGFQALGYKPIFYSRYEELSQCRPDDLLVGRVSTITRKLNEYGIQIEEYDYPTELEHLRGRKIWTDTLDSVLSKTEMWPVFVKPVKDKVFVGFVLRSEKDVPRRRAAKPDEPVICSEVIDFEAEWRAFIRYGNIIDVRPYKGDWRKKFDTEMLEQAVDMFQSAPAGYAMDIGVTESGKTVLVEINDGFALGNYGLEAVEYAKLLSSRWCELVGIYDECDTYREAIDWKKKRRDMSPLARG